MNKLQEFPRKSSPTAHRRVCGSHASSAQLFSFSPTTHASALQLQS